MFGFRSPRAVLVALTIGLAASAFGAGASPSIASAASPHQAAVIVDTGGNVHRVVITFSEDSISGMEALQRAGASPVIYVFGGQGGAVCRLFGVGRDAGPNCLGGQDGDNRYWAYFRAPAGTSKFGYSSIGAGAARVHDGDVEGWKFGTGAAPAFVSLASLAPSLPPPTQPPSTTPATQPSTSSPAPAATPGAVAGLVPAGTPTTASTLPATGAATSGGAGAGARDSGKSTKHAAGAVDHETDANGKPIDTKLASADGSNGGGGSSWSLLLFAFLIIAIAAAVLIVRRVRHQDA